MWACLLLYVQQKYYMSEKSSWSLAAGRASLMEDKMELDAEFDKLWNATGKLRLRQQSGTDKFV